MPGCSFWIELFLLAGKNLLHFEKLVYVVRTNINCALYLLIRISGILTHLIVSFCIEFFPLAGKNLLHFEKSRFCCSIRSTYESQLRILTCLVVRFAFELFLLVEEDLLHLEKSRICCSIYVVHTNGSQLI